MVLNSSNYILGHFVLLSVKVLNSFLFFLAIGQVFRQKFGLGLVHQVRFGGYEYWPLL